MPKAKPKPQTTIVHVAVTTAGPVPMVRVREWVADEMCLPTVYRGIDIDGVRLVSAHVKHDANIERPQR